MSAVSILSVGAFSPIGIDARQTALMLRAAKHEPTASPFRDSAGLTLGSARCVAFEDGLVGVDRLVALAKPALVEALDTLPAGEAVDKDTPVVLLLSLAEPWEDEPQAMSKPADILGAIAQSVGLRLDDRSVVVRLGHAGLAALLARAAMFAHDVRVIVGAVDSYHDASRVKALDSGFRLLSRRAGNGFIPSEAAAFLCVAPQTKRTEGRPAKGVVRFVSTGEEEVTHPPMARTLSKITADPRIPHPAPWVLSDENGERHRLRELVYLRLRNDEVFSADPKSTEFDFLYHAIGELGAATAAICLVYAVVGFELGYAPAPNALILSSSEGTARSLIFVESTTS